jgi:hypothetical protein
VGRPRARNGILRRGQGEICGPRGEPRTGMSFTIGRHERFRGSKSLFPHHELSTTLTTTEIGSEAALCSCAVRASVRGLELPLSRGNNTQRGARVRTYFDEGFTMNMFVTLKVCESCGSLWYRAAGEVKVYCSGCAAKLGEFPQPRLRKRPGGRRKHGVTSSKIFQVPVGGGR